MKKRPVNPLKIVLIPSWLAEILRSTPGYELCSILTPEKLSGILNGDDILIFALLQDSINSLTDSAYSDIQRIDYDTPLASLFESPAVYLEAKNKMREDAQRDREINNSPEIENNKSSLIKDQSPLDGEYYVPVMLDQYTIGLVGTTESNYKDLRAYYNSVIETLSANGVPYVVFKQLEVFRRYLKHAIDD